MGGTRKQLVVFLVLALAGIALVGLGVATAASDDDDGFGDGLLDPFSLDVLDLSGAPLNGSHPSMVRIPFRPTLRSPFRPPLTIP